MARWVLPVRVDDGEADRAMFPGAEQRYSSSVAWRWRAGRRGSGGSGARAAAFHVGAVGGGEVRMIVYAHLAGGNALSGIRVDDDQTRGGVSCRAGRWRPTLPNTSYPVRSGAVCVWRRRRCAHGGQASSSGCPVRPDAHQPRNPHASLVLEMSRNVPARLGVHPVPDAVCRENHRGWWNGPCVGLALQERGGVADSGRRIPVHARQPGAGAPVLGADRHVERAKGDVQRPAATRVRRAMVVDLHAPVLVGLPSQHRGDHPPIGACGNIAFASHENDGRKTLPFSLPDP